MTTFETIEGRRHHCGQIIRRMAPQQLAMFEAVFGNPHRALVQVFAGSYYTRAWLIDGELAALGGVQGTHAGSDGFIWLALSEKARRYSLPMGIEARRQLRAIMQSKTSVYTRCIPDDAESRRFALLLGFRPGPEDTIEYRREWPQVAEPFVVFCLPRSHSRWLASFLSNGAECSHDLPVSVGSVEELCEAIARGGSVETGLTMAWRVLRERFPSIRFAVVRRLIAEVVRSADHVGWAFPQGHLEAEAARLDEIAALPGTITVNSADLGTFDGAKRIYEHCTGKLLDRCWFDEMAPRNIQIDILARTRILMHTAGRMRGLFDEIRGTVTIQRERFGTFYRDGRDLFAAHYAEAGSFDGLPLDPDVDMALALEAQNQLLVMTARQDGHMVGYIVFLINPSFESRGVLLGFQNIFYVKPELRGKLGKKLRDAAKARLLEIGVSFLMLRSGVRARGPHLKAMYAREGAIALGELYMLPLVA